MNLNTNKNIKRAIFSILLVLVAMIVCSGKAHAEESITAYVAKKYENGQLVPGDTYYVVETNVDSEVFISDFIDVGIIRAITPTATNTYPSERYKKADGTVFKDNVDVIEHRGNFDSCSSGCIIYKNDKNILDKSTNKNLSGATNEYIYYCCGSGVKNLTTFLFTSLEQTEIKESQISVTQKNNLEKGDIPTADDFEVKITLDDGSTYILGSGSNTDNPYYVVANAEPIEDGESQVTIVIKDIITKEVTVNTITWSEDNKDAITSEEVNSDNIAEIEKAIEEYEKLTKNKQEKYSEEYKKLKSLLEKYNKNNSEVKAEKEEKDETPKTGDEGDYFLYACATIVVSLAGGCIVRFKK